MLLAANLKTDRLRIKSFVLQHYPIKRLDFSDGVFPLLFIIT
jgi:hypothetical protein